MNYIQNTDIFIIICSTKNYKGSWTEWAEKEGLNK